MKVKVTLCKQEIENILAEWSFKNIGNIFPSDKADEFDIQLLPEEQGYGAVVSLKEKA